VLERGMQFLTSLFGGSENTLVTAALALGIVLILIVFSVWILKFFFRASNHLARGSNKRLTVVDTVSIDTKRQLIIVRRDDVEHLILTGGPQDLVVESDIPVDKPGIVGRRRTPQPAPPAPTATVEPLAPSRPVSDALEAAQSLSTPPPPGTRPMERLRELARPTGSPRKTGSLRHTGLMRPINQGEPAAIIPINPDNSDHRRIDSAKAAPANDTNGQTKLGGATYLGNGFKAEGN
jgi:flagellar protein FliO/FliZ